MKKLGILVLCACFFMAGCSNKPKEEKQTEVPQDVELLQFQEVKSGDTLAVMETSMGTIKIKLFPEQAPKAVENFMTHAQEGYYDNLSFHRVIADFMIQGGDPAGNGTGGKSIWGKPFEDEFSNQLYNFKGALSMANAGSDTNGSQFFIVQQSDGGALDNAYFDSVYQQAKAKKWANAGFVHPNNVKAKYQEVGGTPHLDHMHTVFGQVIEGMDVVDQIASVEVDKNDQPKTAVMIQSIQITTAK